MLLLHSLLHQEEEEQSPSSSSMPWQSLLGIQFLHASFNAAHFGVSLSCLLDFQTIRCTQKKKQKNRHSFTHFLSLHPSSQA